MVIVISHAFTKDASHHADAYVAASRRFLAFMAQHPGFRRRTLVRDLGDPTHFTHLRWFESIEAYEAMTQAPDYPAHIAALSEHLDLARYDRRSARELTQVVLED